MQAKTARHEKTAKPSRKLTRAERKQIEAVVRQAKGDGKAHTVQDSIPFRNMFPDGLCRLDGRTFSKTIAFEDVNYRLASPEDQRDIFEHLCDFYNGYDPTIGVLRRRISGIFLNTSAISTMATTPPLGCRCRSAAGMWSMGRRRTCSVSIPRGTTWTPSGRTRPGYCASSMSGAATAM